MKNFAALTDLEAIPPPIKRREVLVWHASIHGRPWPLDALASWLSPREQTRATAYRFEADRRGYVISHAMLRLQLASQLRGIHPRDVRLSTGLGVKPKLSLPQSLTGYRFSLSRSRSTAVVALTRFGLVGVDIEGVDHASDKERADLRDWVRKEAVVKAIGRGMDDLHRYPIKGDPPVLIRDRRRWPRLLLDVRDLQIPGCKAAIAVSADRDLILIHEWEIGALDIRDATYRGSRNPSHKRLARWTVSS